MPELADLLALDAEGIERPPPHPDGWFEFNVMSYIFGKSAKKKTDQVQFACIDGQPVEGVDTAKWQEFLAEDRKSQCTPTFYLTPDAMIRIKNFQKACGLSLTGRSVGELIPDCVGCKVLVNITHSIDTVDGDVVIYANPSGYKKVE